MNRNRVGVTGKPGLFRSERKHRRQPQRHAAENLLDRFKAGAALLARRRLAIERILANVEIKGREIGVEEGRQPRDDALIVELLVSLS